MILGIEEILYTLSQNRLNLKHVDTAVLTKRGGVACVPLWVSTDSHGRLKSKSSDDIPFRNIIDRFKRIAAVHNPGQKSRKTFVLRFRGERRELSVKGLQQFLKENKSIADGIATLQPCIRPKKKGAGGLFRTTRVPSEEKESFEYVTTRLKAGKKSMECIAPSLLTHINHALSNITEQVLSVLEDVHEMTISYASLDFVVDRNGTTWLTNVHSLQTKQNKDSGGGVVSLPCLRPGSEPRDRKTNTVEERPRSVGFQVEEEETKSAEPPPKRRNRKIHKKKEQQDDSKSNDDELMRFANMVTRLTQENGDLAKRLRAAEKALQSTKQSSHNDSESVEKYKDEVKKLQRTLVSERRKHENEMQIKENEQQTQMLRLEARLNSAIVLEGDDPESRKEKTQQMESVRELVETIKTLQIDNELERRKARAAREEVAVKYTKQINETHRQHQRVVDSLRKNLQNQQDTERNMKNETISLRAEIMSTKSQNQDLFTRLQNLESENKRLEEELRNNTKLNTLRETTNGDENEEEDEDNKNTSSIHRVKALCDAKVRQMENEVEYLKDQLTSESSCKEKLAESLAQLNNQFLQAKSQAKSLLQEQDASHRKEIQEMQRRCQRQVDTQKSETLRMEEKIKRLQINLTEMMKDVSAARQREKESESERLVLEEERRVLQERVEGLKANELDLSEQLTRYVELVVFLCC